MDRTAAELFLTEYEASGAAPGLPAGLPGEYMLLSCLKCGPESQIYLLRGRDDGAEYVLRTAPGQDLARLMREHLALKRLHDPAFPKPVACFSRGEHACLIREYIPGVSLADLVENGEIFTPARAAALTVRLCRVIGLMHGLNPPLIHRDIKPQNVILSTDGAPHLVDLDAAQAYHPGKPLDTVVMGTPLTAAPEQFGYRRCDPRTDVYGLGMLLAFLLTGDYEEAGIRGSLGRVVKKALRFDPGKRYPTVRAFEKRLNAWQHRWRRRGAALAVLLLLLGGGWAAQSNWDGLWHAAAVFSMAQARQTHIFASPLVERAVRERLGRPEGDIAREEMAALTELYLCGETTYDKFDDLGSCGHSLILDGKQYEGYASLADFSDFKDMPNLHKLGLSRLNITDAAPLANLPLTHLSLGGNQIKDLGPVLRLSQLVSLDISDNPISSLSGIESLKMLEYLGVGALPVTDISPLKKLELYRLNLCQAAAGLDYSVLAELTTLDNFSGQDMPKEALPCLSALPNLKWVMLINCGFDDFSIFYGAKDLQWLFLHTNALTTLDGVEKLPNLTFLNVDNNKLTDISAASALPALAEIDVANNPLTDLSQVLGMPALKTLVLSRAQEALLPIPAADCPFSILYMD